MKFLNLRKKFITKFIIDGKKYNSFYILNNIFQFLNIKNKHNYQIFNIFFLIIEPLFYIEKINLNIKLLLNTDNEAQGGASVAYKL